MIVLWILHHPIQYIKNCWVELLSNDNIKYICTIYTRLDTCLMYISRFSLRDKEKLWLLKLHFVGVDVVEWSRALEIRLIDWCCSVSNVWAQISSKEEQSLTAQKSNSNTIPKNSTHGEMARNIARLELKATISLWTIFITILGKWHTDYLKLYWLICVINIAYLNSNMFDVFVFIQIDQYRLCLSISAIDFYPALVQFEQSKSIDWLNVCYLRSLTKI